MRFARRAMSRPTWTLRQQRCCHAIARYAVGAALPETATGSQVARRRGPEVEVLVEAAIGPEVEVLVEAAIGRLDRAARLAWREHPVHARRRFGVQRLVDLARQLDRVGSLGEDERLRLGAADGSSAT